MNSVFDVKTTSLTDLPRGFADQDLVESKSYVIDFRTARGPMFINLVTSSSMAYDIVDVTGDDYFTVAFLANVNIYV